MELKRGAHGPAEHSIGDRTPGKWADTGGELGDAATGIGRDLAGTSTHPLLIRVCCTQVKGTSSAGLGAATVRADAPTTLKKDASVWIRAIKLLHLEPIDPHRERCNGQCYHGHPSGIRGIGIGYSTNENGKHD
jgi:hypothetical protein